MELKKKAELAQETVNKAEGALGQVMTRLKKEFKCNSLEEAKKKLKQLERQEKNLIAEFKKEMVSIQEKMEKNNEPD